MILRTTRFLGAVALSLGFFTAGAALTHPASAQSDTPVRGERGSRHDIRSDEQRLARMIERLEHDRRDYGGHRVSAIGFLRQADQQLQAAVAVDRNTAH